MRIATENDWEHIHQWRADHFARICPRPIEGQKGLQDAIWLVLGPEGKPTAATSVLREGIRLYVYDLYAAPGRVLDGFALGKFLVAWADSERLDIHATTDPENMQFRRILARLDFIEQAVSESLVELVRESKDSVARETLDPMYEGASGRFLLEV